MHVYITVIVEYFLKFLALKKIKPPLVRTTVWISHCWEMVYKKFKCITSQSCNLFPLLRTSTGRSTQRREHPKEGVPTRGNSFQMRKTWIHILNYYQIVLQILKDIKQTEEMQLTISIKSCFVVVVLSRWKRNRWRNRWRSMTLTQSEKIDQDISGGIEDLYLWVLQPVKVLSSGNKLQLWLMIHLNFL